MRIALATPLYPPEIAEPAPYTKELAKRLSEHHEVSVVTYAHLPEAVPGVHMIAVEKHRPLPVRLASYFRALTQATRNADVVYAVNGTSIELPASIVTTFSRTPLFFCIADTAAHARAKSKFFSRIIEQFISARAKNIITSLPLPRPEILPLEPYPTEAFAAYEASWTEHLELLTKLFNHVD